MEVYTTKWDKINLVTTFLLSGPPSGWLFLVGAAGGEGKSMATNEAITLWRKSLGEDVEDPCSESDIIRLPCNNDSNAFKIVLMKKDNTSVKTIVHINGWNPHWEFMASEWDAQVARFERSDL